MKQISKKLSLKKKTVAVLNDQELNNIKGGKKSPTQSNHAHCTLDCQSEYPCV